VRPTNDKSDDHDSRLPLHTCAAIACVLEAAIPKPGNVHRGADFADTSFLDFLVSAQILGRVLEEVESLTPGELVLRAVTDTRRWVGKNTNLGLALLIVPLAKAHSLRLGERLEQDAVAAVLNRLEPEDSARIYEAIRCAAPGGLGTASTHDVREPPPENLLWAMQAAADRDLIAAQYVNRFADLFQFVLPAISRRILEGWTVTEAVIDAFVRTMAAYPDSLIGRKCGLEMARQASTRAAQILQHPAPSSRDYLQGLQDLDFWLRSDGNRRNPGTTADMIGAALFVALVNGQLPLPLPLG
jgi:triphosphoribosyl-dephospho-CoA synthase